MYNVQLYMEYGIMFILVPFSAFLESELYSCWRQKTMKTKKRKNIRERKDGLNQRVKWEFLFTAEILLLHYSLSKLLTTKTGLTTEMKSWL